MEVYIGCSGFRYDDWKNNFYRVLFTWKDRLDKLNDIDQLFIYFNNDQNANAIENANNLKALFDV